jgi:RNA polymerase sporulation-specific sigma factor
MLSSIILFTSKLENTKSFPHPLSPEKEAEYLRLFKEENNLEARDTLIKHNLRLVVFIAKKYTNYPDREDLISIGTIGLIKAINSYKSSKGVQLATYASRCIENEILMTMRAFKRTQGEVSLYEKRGCDSDGNETKLIDILSIEEESVYKKIEFGMVSNLLKQLISKYLKKRERDIIYMRFGLEDETSRTQEEVSKKLGISRSYVSRIEKAALQKLKKAIKKEDILL